jgi:hypothetical protein
MSNIDKVERYDWAKPGDRGRQCKLPIDDLLIDHSYQRQPLGERKILAIAKFFSWVAFGAVVVMERDNGQKFVVDGQQRLLAVRRRGDIREIPCVLFQSDGPAHEAIAFEILNCNRKYVSSVERFRAAAVGGKSPEKEIFEWLASIRMRVTSDGSDRDGISFPTQLLKTWRSDPELTKKSIMVQKSIVADEPLLSVIHKGIIWLSRRGIDVDKYSSKLMQMGGRTGVMAAIRAMEIQTGIRDAYEVSGMALLKMINYKRKSHKIRIQPDDSDQ